MIEAIRREASMRSNESPNVTEFADGPNVGDAPSRVPPPPGGPWWLEPMPPPPTGLYLGLACLGSLAVAVVLLLTPWFDLFFPVFLAAVPLGAAGIASASRDSRRRGLMVSTVGTTIAVVLLVQALLLLIFVVRNG
jgi:hypothetical protein